MRPLATLSHETLQPMAPSGRRVTDSREEIVGYLRDMLSEDHAALLADGALDPTTGNSTWYTDLPGEAMRYDAAPPERQEAAYQRLQTLLADIRAETDRLSASGARGDQLLARMLSAAIEVPDTGAIYIVGDRPVLVGWGHLRAGDDPPRGVIGSLDPPQRTAAPPPPPPQPPPQVAPTAPAPPPSPITPVGGGVAALEPERRTSFWPLLLLWVLLALLLAAILISLLSACGVGLPPRALGPMLVGRCPIPVAADPDRSALVAESQHGRSLEDTIRRLELAIQERAGQCDAEVAALPEPVPEPVPSVAPESEPEPEPAEVVPDTQPPDEDDEEFDRRVEEQGGQSDETQITLMWDSTDDLDLKLRCPDGQLISYQNPSRCNAVLDVDVNESDRNLVRDAVENIVFQGPPPPGQYQVVVDVYKTRESANRPIPFRVRLVITGERRVIEGVSRPPHRPLTIAEFTLP
ncbi:hypothetical protein F1188_18400 [Roseospira marina]|uniref:Uncharacterized protein n=1 Tax=Roseospira marina TaxID=140057 RepID=A0A5M6I7N3_9PROT|nr:hypothetical protein [Roseospira marina]KAA5603907.1 hypothetical protein F1188_18400 [Roseospira marina]MBB4315968.1 hypothetical protein [Roseospira marina]MBB5089162.1 hypothetical protein [Roseospira marina]